LSLVQLDGGGFRRAADANWEGFEMVALANDQPACAIQAAEANTEGLAMDDADLVRQVLRGRQVTAEGNLTHNAAARDAYALLVDRYTASVYAVCRACIGHGEDAHDLVQEALRRGLEDLDTLRCHERFGLWLRGIARNLFRDWCRGRERDREARERGREAQGENMDERAAPETPADERADVRAAVDRLPGKYREVIYLYYLAPEKYTYQQIAHMLGISVGTVHARIKRGRELLMEMLGSGAQD
jgi:RNA polymerase sigma-70 factor (ECF subfamily)